MKFRAFSGSFWPKMKYRAFLGKVSTPDASKIFVGILSQISGEIRNFGQYGNTVTELQHTVVFNEFHHTMILTYFHNSTIHFKMYLFNTTFNVEKEVET